MQPLLPPGATSTHFPLPHPTACRASCADAESPHVSWRDLAGGAEMVARARAKGYHVNLEMMFVDLTKTGGVIPYPKEDPQQGAEVGDAGGQPPALPQNSTSPPQNSPLPQLGVPKPRPTARAPPDGKPLAKSPPGAAQRQVGPSRQPPNDGPPMRGDDGVRQPPPAAN